MSTPQTRARANELPRLLRIVLKQLVERRAAEELDAEHFESQINRICTEQLHPRGLNLMIAKSTRRQHSYSIKLIPAGVPFGSPANAPRFAGASDGGTEGENAPSWRQSPGFGERVSGAVSSKASRRTFSRSDGRVLIVEEHRETAVALARLLTRWGLAVYVAHDEEVGLNLARDYRPGFVIMSLELPHLDSSSALPEFRARGRCQDSTFIGISVNEEWDLRRCQEAGFEHWMFKPLDVPQLKEILTGASN